jgi:hypothetical protein
MVPPFSAAIRRRDVSDPSTIAAANGAAAAESAPSGARATGAMQRRTPPQERGVDNCRKLSFFSRTYEKAVVRLARLHRRIRTIRQDFLHKVATGLAKARPVLVAEDLNVRGLARNGSLSRAMLDVGWGPSGGCWSIGFVPIDPNAGYRVVVNNFIAGGGDGCSVLQRGANSVV